MTYVGPFTQATLMYEPDEASPKGEVATPGTILDYVAKNLPHFLPIIKKAGQLPFYNATALLFVPKRLPPDTTRPTRRYNTTAPANSTAGALKKR